MKLTRPQRNVLLLGMVFAIALLPLVGGLHHHHHDAAHGVCWFCATASASTLPLAIQMLALAIARVPHPLVGLSAPPRFLWMARYRRGPPCLSLA